MVSERTSVLLELILKDNNDPFALQTFESDEIAADPGRLIDEVNAIGLFGGERVIKIRLNGSRIITKSIEMLLNEPSGGSIVIIEAGDLKKNHAIRALLEKSPRAAVLPCYADDYQSLSTLIKGEMEKAGISMARDAQQRLISLLGEDRKTSRNEIAKLTLYAHGRNEITLHDIDQLIGDASASLTDNTIDAILSGRTKEGLQNFEQSLTMGHEAFQTASTLLRHLNNLQLWADQINKGKSIRQTLDQARPPIFFKRKAAIEDQLQRWGSEDIAKAQDHLLDAIRQSRIKPVLSTVSIHAVLLKLATFAARKNRH